MNHPELLIVLSVAGPASISGPEDAHGTGQ